LLTHTNSTCEYIISDMVAPVMTPTYLSSEHQDWNTSSVYQWYLKLSRSPQSYITADEKATAKPRG
jgi:hypothetical protein